MYDLLNTILNALSVLAIVYLIIDNKIKRQENVQLKYVDSKLGVFTYKYYLDNSDLLDKQYCMMVDCKGIKKLNNTQGYAVGDRKIIGTAKILVSNCHEEVVVRKNDSGDEFLIFSPNMDALIEYKNRIEKAGADVYIGIGFNQLEAEKQMNMKKVK